MHLFWNVENCREARHPMEVKSVATFVANYFRGWSKDAAKALLRRNRRSLQRAPMMGYYLVSILSTKKDLLFLLADALTIVDVVRAFIGGYLSQAD